MLKVLTLIIGLGLITPACVTSSSSKRGKKTAKTTSPKKKRGSKLKNGERPAQTSRSEIASSTNLSAWEFVARHVNRSEPLTPSDLAFLNSLPTSPRQGSLEESVVVLGLLKRILAGPGFQEVDLVNSTEEKPASAGSLEALSIEAKVNLPAALKNNPVLRSAGIFGMAVEAANISVNSSEFVAALNNVVSTEIELWAKISQDEIRVNEDGGSVAEGSTTRSSAVATADFRNGDSLLVEAQALADNKLYEDAITKANLIQQASPFYSAAQDRIVSFSNKAVQELRQKAAQAFQTAIPMNDPDEQQAYLTKAKEYLEDALLNYPRAPADQLSTVRENLAVITNNIDRLGQSSQEQ